MLGKRVPAAQRGYLLRQVLGVVILLGLLAAVVVSRMEGGGPEYNAQVADLKSHLRYAKLRAEESAHTGDYRFWGIRRSSERYQLVAIDAAGDDSHRLLPGQRRIFVEADQLNFVDSFQAVYFDADGRPHVGWPPAPATVDVDVTTGYRPVRVIRNTGIIP